MTPQFGLKGGYTPRVATGLPDRRFNTPALADRIERLTTAGVITAVKPQAAAAQDGG